MESWVCLLLLLHCAAVTVSQSCTQEGAVKIIGTVTPTLIAGRLEICVDRFWRAVYDEEWDITEARIVCQQKGFPPERARACSGSCFGDSPLISGYHFQCGEQASALSECRREIDECCCDRYSSCFLQNDFCCALEDTRECRRLACSANAGVVCMTNNSFLPTASPVQREISQTDSLTTSSEEEVINSQDVTNRKCSSTEAGLGVALIIALLALVGVVIAWVWSCYRTKLTTKQQSLNVDGVDNPQYTPTFPSVQYSTLFPRNSPATHNTTDPTPSDQQEAGYQVLGPQLANTSDRYETAPAPKYNRLQHK